MAFEFPVRIYWEDTDAGGIVYHANYVNFFERARTEWLRSLGLGQRALKSGELGESGMFVVAEVNVRYLLPTRLDDELTVTAEALPPTPPAAASARPDSAAPAQPVRTGRSSLVLRQCAYLRGQPENGANAARGADDAHGASAANTANATHAHRTPGTLACEGTIRLCWVDAHTLRPARIPAAVLEKIAP